MAKAKRALGGQRAQPLAGWVTLACAIATLTLRPRDEVDLDNVRADLVAVTNDTVHPAHAGVWLRRQR